MEFPATTWEGVAYVHTMGGIAARDLDAAAAASSGSATSARS